VCPKSLRARKMISKRDDGGTGHGPNKVKKILVENSTRHCKTGFLPLIHRPFPSLARPNPSAIRRKSPKKSAAMYIPNNRPSADGEANVDRRVT
jgi:hypothetical protein